ncbi:abortive infection family protein [Sorangium sp. So ce1000]|uniref:abortive infection family protein n=1 Tax=Sorangium sp. So ce1000 TaxID=3133325 RepID=UPI003F609082
MTIPMVPERLLPELVAMAKARGMTVERDVLRASTLSLTNLGEVFGPDDEWQIYLYMSRDVFKVYTSSAIEATTEGVLTIVRELFKEKPAGYINSVHITEVDTPPPAPPPNTITVLTRRNLFDELRLTGLKYWGRLEEIEFLNRLFDLGKLRSHDRRYDTADEDISTHRISFPEDWPDDWWVISDGRFNILDGSDDNLLRFLCEMIHPIVRPDASGVTQLLDIFNRHLKADGWEIYESRAISGRPVFSPRKLLVGRQVVGHAVDTARKITAIAGDYINQQITRMNAAADGDPELAIGSAKEFVETVCKSILQERGIDHDEGWDLPKLVKTTMEELKLVPEGVPDQEKAVDTIKRFLGNLSQVTFRLAELRNPYGTGHGKVATTKGLSPRHARLAIGSATTLGTFLYETHQETLKK